MLVYLYIIRLWRDLSPGHGVSTCPALGPRQRNGHGGVLLVLLLGRLHALQRLAQARHGPALATVFAVALTDLATVAAVAATHTTIALKFKVSIGE